MKRITLTFIVLIVGFCFVTSAFAADKAAIKKQVDTIVAAINGGKTAADFKSAATNKPSYVFIMEEDGNLLVHPSLIGQSPTGKHETFNLKEKAQPVYKEVIKATTEGVWVSYEWKGKKKHTYVRKTNSGLIVGSGY